MVIRTSSDPDWNEMNEMNKSNDMGCETLSQPILDWTLGA